MNRTGRTAMTAIVAITAELLTIRRQPAYRGAPRP